MQRECVRWFFKIKDDMTPTEKKNTLKNKRKKHIKELSNDNYCN